MEFTRVATQRRGHQAEAHTSDRGPTCLVLVSLRHLVRLVLEMPKGVGAIPLGLIALLGRTERKKKQDREGRSFLRFLPLINASSDSHRQNQIRCQLAELYHAEAYRKRDWGLRHSRYTEQTQGRPV